MSQLQELTSVAMFDLARARAGERIKVTLGSPSHPDERTVQFVFEITDPPKGGAVIREIHETCSGFLLFKQGPASVSFPHLRDEVRVLGAHDLEDSIHEDPALLVEGVIAQGRHVCLYFPVTFSAAAHISLEVRAVERINT